MKMKRQIGKRLRKEVWQQETVAQAEQGLRQLVQDYEEVAPKLADWLEGNIPEGFAVYPLPAELHRSLCTTNPLECGLNQEIKRRTQLVRVFPNAASLLFLVSAILYEIDQQWAQDSRRYPRQAVQ